MIDINKKYVTRDGREVRIYATDGGLENCITHGAAKNKSGYWESASWYTAHGGYYDDGVPHQYDLIEVRQKITRTYWLIHWRKGDSSICFFQPIDPASMAPECIAITGPHEITFTEGEGL